MNNRVAEVEIITQMKEGQCAYLDPSGLGTIRDGSAKRNGARGLAHLSNESLKQRALPATDWSYYR